MLSYRLLKSLLDKSPNGIIKFTARARQIVGKVALDDFEKGEIIKLMSSGIVDEEEYIKFCPKLMRKDVEDMNASVDYFRCILAKALYVTFEKLKLKYRNEAARKIFFEKLAAITENIHLSQSPNGVRELFNSQSEDELVNYVMGQALSFVENGYSPDLELDDKLENASVEFHDYIRRMEILTGVKWESADKYIDDLKIVSFFDPWHYEDEKTKIWGVKYYFDLHVLNVNPPLMFFDGLRKAVLAREAARLFIPNILDQVDYIFEQAEYFAYKFLPDKYEKEFWLCARHGLRQDTRKGAERILDFFPFYEGLVGNHLYKQVYSRLDELRKSAVPVKSLMDYQLIFDAIAAKPELVKFDERELKLLRLLSSQPRISDISIAHLMGLSVPTAMKLITDLSQKASLRFTILTDMDKIGLHEYLLFLRTSRESELKRIFLRIPYCRSLYRIYGTTDFFIVMDVPSQKQDFINNLVKKLRERNLISYDIVCEPQLQFYNINFDYYDVKAGAWNIYWDNWGMSLRKRLLESDTRQTAYGKLKRSAAKVKIDSIDIKIMDKLFWNFRRAYSEIGRAIGVSGAYVGRKVQKLLRNNVFTPFMVSHKMGAEDRAFILIDCDRGSAEAIASFFDKLPAWRGCLVSGDINGIVGELYVPLGEIEQLFKAIDDQLVNPKIVNNCLFHVVGKWSKWIRWLPVDLYSDENGWAFNEERYFEIIK
jgi:DNA-binding Lrp family transcriptional regulator